MPVFGFGFVKTGFIVTEYGFSGTSCRVWFCEDQLYREGVRIFGYQFLGLAL